MAASISPKWPVSMYSVHGLFRGSTVGLEIKVLKLLQNHSWTFRSWVLQYGQRLFLPNLRTSLTPDSSIFTVSAVLTTDWVGATGIQQSFGANALHVVEPRPSTARNNTLAIAQSKGIYIGETQLPAHHLSIQITPAIVTHSTPDVIEADLDATFSVVRPISEPDITSWTTYNEGGH